MGVGKIQRRLYRSFWEFENGWSFVVGVVGTSSFALHALDVGELTMLVAMIETAMEPCGSV